MRRFILATIAAVIFASPVFAQAPEAIGRITSLEGVADIARTGAEKAFLKEGSPIYISDRIRTKSYSKVAITFADKSVVKLAPNTCIRIEDYRITGSDKRESATIDLTRGTVEAIVSKTGAPNTFHITTPNAKGSVKGSDIFVSFQAGKTGVLVKEGLMSVANLALPEEKIEVPGGDAALIMPKEAPTSTRPYLEAEMKLYQKNVQSSLRREWVAIKGAAQMTAAVSNAAGEVRIYKKGATDWRAVKMNELIVEGDKLQTGETGRAEIRLSNGNLIFLQPGTELAIVKLQFDPSTGEFDNTFESERGKIKAVIEKLGKKSTFQIKTPTALCGARGTVMYLDTQPASTQAFFEGGGGIMTSPITGQTQLLEPGQNANADLSGGISSPAFTSTDQKLANDQTFGQQESADAYSTPNSSATEAAAGTTAALGEAAGGLSSSADAALSSDVGTTGAFTDSPTFNEVAGASAAAVTTVYTSPNLFQDTGTTVGFNTVVGTISTTSDNKFTGSVLGYVIANVTATWTLVLTGGSDTITITGTPTLNYLANTNWTGTVAGSANGANPHMTLIGTASGVAESGGTFKGTMTGTWSNP